MAKPGPKSVYNSAVHDLMVKNSSHMGLTPSEIAEIIGISEKTFYHWMHINPSFLDAYQLGKANADKRVLMAFYQAACLGTTTTKRKRSKNLKTGEVIETVETVETPPNAGSMQNWLANRIPHEWHLGRIKPVEEVKEEETQHDVTITVISKDTNAD